MKIICRSVYVFFILAAISSNLYAGEYAELKFIGFSKDGKYLAFENFGVYDGSGTDFSSTHFIDVEKNSDALPPVVIEGLNSYEKDYQASEIKAKKLRALTAANLRRLKIIPFNTGNLLVSQLRTDWTHEIFSVPDGGKPEIIKFTSVVYAVNNENQYYYELRLDPVLAKDKICGEDTEYHKSYKFELTLADKTNWQPFPIQILQKDGILPARRECPSGYKIERVYFYGQNIAVFIQFYNQGFEGTSSRYLVVTAKLSQKPG